MTLSEHQQEIAERIANGSQYGGTKPIVSPEEAVVMMPEYQ